MMNKVYVIIIQLIHNNKYLCYDYYDLNRAIEMFKFYSHNKLFWGDSPDTLYIKLYKILPEENRIQLIKEWRPKEGVKE